MPSPYWNPHTETLPRERLEALQARKLPFAQRNAVKAPAALWQVADGLGRQPGQIYDVGA